MVAGSTLVVLVGLPGLARLRSDPLDGVGLYTAVAVMSFGILSLLWLGSPAIPAPGVGPDEISEALLIVAFGLGAFLAAAIAVCRPCIRPRLRFSARGGAPPALLVLLFGVGGLTTAAGLMLGVIGYASTTGGPVALLPSAQVFAQGSVLGSLVVLACALQAFGAGDQRARRLLPWLLVAQVAVGFASGFKGQALLPVVYVGIAYVTCAAVVPWRPLALLAIVVVGVLLPANLVYRSALRGADGSTPREVISLAAQNTTARFRLIDHVALINARTPSVYAYGDGTRYLYLPLLIAVPRALWPEKPILDDGIRFSQTYWEIPPISRTSTPLTQVGDLVRNFGVVGVPIGLAIWGAVVAGFLALCRRLSSPRVEMVYLVSLVAWVTYIEGDLPTLVAAASRSMPVVVAVAWLLMPGRHQAAGYRVMLDWGTQARTKRRGSR